MSDFIDRQAAIDALADYIHNVDKVMGTWHLTADDCKDAAASVFEELPSAQPERKKGKWILTEDDNYEYCTCSECGYQNGENWMNGSDIPFCANCGADMRGDMDD